MKPRTGCGKFWRKFHAIIHRYTGSIEYRSLLPRQNRFLKTERNLMKLKTTARCSIKFLFATLIAIIVSDLPARAWNNVGHRTVAEIAWRKLDQNERRAVSDLLKQHPHYNELLAVRVPAGVDTNEWVFLCAAVWPDWVRPAKKGQPHKPDSITKYNLYPHGIGYPFMRSAETNRALI